MKRIKHEKKRGLVQESLVSNKTGEAVPLFRWRLDASNIGMFVFYPKGYHYHFYLENGMVKCHLKNELTGSIIPVNVIFSDLLTRAIRERGIPL